MWDRFDPRRGSARTWLLGIARTTALDWFRAEARRRKREEAAALDERVEEAFVEGLSPELETALTSLSARRARGTRTADRARARRRCRRARARNQPDGRLHAALAGAQATRGEGERGMTVNEIVDELRGSRPRAGDALRLQVLMLASTPSLSHPRCGSDSATGDGSMLALPAAATVAVVAAVAVGVTRPSPAPVASDAIASKATAERSATAPPGAAAFAGPAQDAAGAATAKAPRRRRDGHSATARRSTLGVDDTDALSTATQQALAIARDLGGYVVAVQYATGTAARRRSRSAPFGEAAAAVTRLSGLGTILAQNVQIDDLQESLERSTGSSSGSAHKVAALHGGDRPADTAAERARLVERRAQAQAQLQALRRTAPPPPRWRRTPRSSSSYARTRVEGARAGLAAGPRPRQGAGRARLGGRRRARAPRRRRPPRARRVAALG